MESRWEIGGRQTRRNKRKRAKAAWPADIHRGHVNRNRVCDLVGHSSGQLNSGIVPSNVARILEAGGRGGDKTASKQRGGGRGRPMEDCWKREEEEGAARSKLHRYGKRLGQVVTVTMVGAPIVIAARYTEATPRRTYSW